MAQIEASTPKEVEALSELLYGVLPRIRITDLLEEVDRWTGFTDSFTHLRTGLPPGEKRTLLTALLADGINMGLKRMAEACRGASFWQLARAVDWHVREETYVQATARLVDAQRALPIAALWGDGTMSSSDGQFFQAGGHGAPPRRSTPDTAASPASASTATSPTSSAPSTARSSPRRRTRRPTSSTASSCTGPA